MALSASYRGQDEKEVVFSFLGWAESLGSFPGGKEMFVYYSISVCILQYMFVYYSICLHTTVYVCILQYISACYSGSHIHRYNEVIHFP